MKKKIMNYSKTRRASGPVRTSVLGILVAAALLAAPGTAVLEAAPIGGSVFEDRQRYRAHDRYEQRDRDNQPVMRIAPRGMVRLGLLTDAARPVDAPFGARAGWPLLETSGTDQRRPVVEVMVERWSPAIPPWHSVGTAYGLIVEKPESTVRPLADGPGDHEASAPEHHDEPAAKPGHKDPKGNSATGGLRSVEEERPTFQDYDYQEDYLGSVAPG